MHIPDGYLSPQTYAPLAVAVVPFWVVALRKLKKTLHARQIPLLALAGAFSFVIMMFNIPLPGGSSGHAVGATLIAIMLGPWAAVVAVSIALIIQCLVFGDGGVTAIGANCLNMAVIIPFVGYGLFRLISGKSERGSLRSIVAAGIASYIALNVAATTAAVEFGIQPLIAHAPDGTPLYCPYGLKVAVPAMLAGHLTLFGAAEVIVTAVPFAFLARRELFRQPVTTKAGVQ
jgi:cobalt/nickel transport system permease protein